MFISDNTSLNDVVVRLILSQLDINNNSSHRARYLGYIINLTAQASILGKDYKVFSINAKAAKIIVNVNSLRLLTL